MLISFHLQLSCFDLVSTLYYCCIIIITVWSLELNAFIHPSSSVCLLLSCLRFLSSGIFSFLCDGRNGRHRNREPMVKWEKDWGRKERQAMRKIQKEGGPTLRSALHPFLPRSSSLLFLFFLELLLKLSSVTSIHPPALFLILHLSLWVLELRATYTSWVWQTVYDTHN